MVFTQIIFANTLLHTYNQLILLKTRFPSHTPLTKERILIFSSWTRQLQLKQGKNAFYIMTSCVRSFDTMQKM